MTRQSKSVSRNYARCPFSKTGCRECPIYRGRHCHINGPEGEALKAAARKKSEADWMVGFSDFLDELNGPFGSIRSSGWEEPDESEQ